MEVNARVNYPIKNALRDMEQRGIIDMEFEHTQFYVSSVTLRVARVGMQRTVQAWNHHPIPGMNHATHLFLTLKPSHPTLTPTAVPKTFKLCSSVISFKNSL